MSYFIEKQGEIEHEYFQAGPGKKIYLGRKDKPENSKPENILKALNYLGEKNEKNYEIYGILLSKLPQEKRDKYILALLENIDSYSDKKLIPSLSEAKQKEYKEKRITELQTEPRQKVKKSVILKGLVDPITKAAASAASPSREEIEKTKTKKKKANND